MILILIFIFLFISAAITDITFREDFELPGLLSVIFGLILGLWLLVLALQRNRSRDFVRSFHQLEKTIEHQRNDSDPIERAALTNKMLETNSALVNAQHYAQSPWTSWFYDNSTGLKDLKPLE